MKIDDRKGFILIAVVFIGVSFYYWFTRDDIAGAAVFFSFGIAVPALALMKERPISHAKLSGWLRTLGLLPRPTEASMLVLALTTLALISVNNLWSTVFDSIRETSDIRAPFLLIYLFFGILLSLYHAFSNRKKSKYEEAGLRVYLITTLIMLSIYTAFFTLEDKQPAHIIFAAWSGLQALVLITVVRYLPLEYVALPDRDARLVEAFLAIIVVALGIWIGHFVFQTHWAVTFTSIIAAWSFIQQFFEPHAYDTTPQGNH